ncbi:hypothetical protein EV702DRAFT_1278159 [Suillus placidus]|uniref:Uncharacterized protein n=1 Tax=Suillus placidus TaxID=48579 RepID=A0A9P7D4E0_9AGAM|nr:hypothetical protein EV702DRAFT_1278159 [Suillus placidus]
MAPYWLVRATTTTSTIPSPASLKGPVDGHSSGKETLLSGTFVPKQRWCQCMLLTQVMSILSIPLPPSSNLHQWRHSSAGVVQLSPARIRTSIDELMLDDKKNQALNHRAVSIAYKDDKTARLWNLDNGQPISSPLQHAEQHRPPLSTGLEASWNGADKVVKAPSCNGTILQLFKFRMRRANIDLRLSNLLRFSPRTTAVQNDQHCDPLDFSATLPLPRPLPGRTTTQGHSDMNPGESSRPLSTTRSSAAPPPTFADPIHHLSSWWPVCGGHTQPDRDHRI